MSVITIDKTGKKISLSSMWAIRMPDGTLVSVARRRKYSILSFCAERKNWKYWYRKGCRAVHVSVTDNLSGLMEYYRPWKEQVRNDGGEA